MGQVSGPWELRSSRASGALRCKLSFPCVTRAEVLVEKQFAWCECDCVMATQCECECVPFSDDTVSSELRHTPCVLDLCDSHGRALD